MESQNLKLSSIQSLHNTIDNSARTNIEQKGELVKELNNKKEYLISAIQEELRKCRNAERTIFSNSNNEYYNQVEEYNVYLKNQHDRGSELIGNINSAKNFQQLNQVEMTLVNSFLNDLRARCSTFIRAVPTLPVPVPLPAPIVNNYYSSTQPLPPITLPVSLPVMNNNNNNTATEVQTTGYGRTDIDVNHNINGTDVNVAKEESFGSPAHSVHISGAKGPVKVTHHPTSTQTIPQVLPPLQQLQPLQQLPRLVQPVIHTVVPMSPVTPVRTVAVTPVTPVRPIVPVTPVQSVRQVVVAPVAPVIRTVPAVRAIPVSPIIPVRTVAVAPVKTVIQPVVQSVVAVPTVTRAVVTHDYVPRNQDGTKISVAAGTVVNVESYNGDWALVNTGSSRGYISRHYLRQF